MNPCSPTSTATLWSLRASCLRSTQGPRSPYAVRSMRGGGWPFSFFFSSRRRHTSCSRDWSSDVCSSDLVYVRFPVTGPVGSPLVGTSILVWTTTPWTLISNLGLAVDPSAAYARVSYPSGDLIVAVPLLKDALGLDTAATEEFPGADLVG